MSGNAATRSTVVAGIRVVQAGGEQLILFVSQIFVLVLGITVIGFAGWGMFAPGKLIAFAKSSMDRHWGIYSAVIVRLVLGIALIIASPASPFPIVFQVLGWLAIVAAVAIAAAGRQRVRRFIAWWSERSSPQFVRLWLLFGIAFGIIIIYGVL